MVVQLLLIKSFTVYLEFLRIVKFISSIFYSDIIMLYYTGIIYQMTLQCNYFLQSFPPVSFHAIWLCKWTTLFYGKLQKFNDGGWHTAVTLDSVVFVEGEHRNLRHTVLLQNVCGDHAQSKSTNCLSLKGVCIPRTSWVLMIIQVTLSEIVSAVFVGGLR